MKRTLLFPIFFAFFSTKLSAFPCFFTLAKDSCWTNYDVNVTVMDAEKNKTIVTINVPKGTPWAREPFNCDPGQKMLYLATYQPIFWQSEVGKTYQSLRYWSLPSAPGPKETAWNISVCFPSDFSAVPLPPDAKGDCHCDFKSIPAPPPQA